MKQLKIGLLIPRSSSFPLFAQHTLKSIKYAFADTGTDAQFFYEDIGKGVDADITISKANNLIMNDVDITFAVKGKKIDEPLSELYSKSQKLLIFIDAGANVPYDAKVYPHVYTSSLDLWQNLYLLGKYAAEHLGKKAVTTSSFFDAGYTVLSAFNEGFSLNGGNVAAVHICRDFAPEDFTIGLTNHINDTQPDFLLASYGGKDATDFHSLAVEPGVIKNLPVVSTGLWSSLFTKANPVTQALSVYKNGDLASMFTKRFADENKVAPDAMAVLAYETSLVVCHALKTLPGDFDAEQFCTQLENTEMEVPRGTFSFDPTTHKNRNFPVLIEAANGTTLETILPEEEHARVSTIFAERISAGWLNPYPCS